MLEQHELTPILGSLLWELRELRKDFGKLLKREALAGLRVQTGAALGGVTIKRQEYLDVLTLIVNRVAQAPEGMLKTSIVAYLVQAGYRQVGVYINANGKRSHDPLAELVKAELLIRWFDPAKLHSKTNLYRWFTRETFLAAGLTNAPSKDPHE